VANFKLKESADKVSAGTTLSGVNIIPQAGFIMPFAGTTAPSGWALCDGTGGTPDLTGYFLIGATSSGNVGSVTGSNTHTHSYTFIGLTYENSVNTHQDPGYYTNLNAGGADASHTHIINVAVNTPSHYSGNFINWSNGNNTNRTFRSHDHVGNINYNSAGAAEGNHVHSGSGGTINHTVSETAHNHANSSSPSGTTPTASVNPPNITMNYIIKL
jgi:hypothetical protein